MARLLLLRHAKAERPAAGLGDHDRPLSGRGRDDAVAIGKIIAERGDAPARVLCSTSLRTRETWEGVRAALKKPPEPRFLDEIYQPDGDYIPIVRREGGKAKSVLVIGHNPCVQVTALRLAEDLGGNDGAAMAVSFPTAAVAVFDFDGHWGDLFAGTARLAAFVRLGEGGGD